MFFFKSCGQLVLQSKRSSHHYQTLGFRNSTFFPSYRPKVLMDEDDEISSVATDDTTGYPSVRLVNLAFSYDISILTYQSAFTSELNIQRVSENTFILWKLWRLLDVIYCCCVARKTAVKLRLCKRFSGPTWCSKTFKAVRAKLLYSRSVRETL